MDSKLLSIFFVCLILMGCNSKKEGETPIACSKTVTSEWTSSDIGVTFDLSSFQMGVIGSTLFNYVGGEVCDVSLRITGNDCSGSFIITGGTYQGGGSGDPGCADLSGIKDYSISGIRMRYCNANDNIDCDEFE